MTNSTQEYWDARREALKTPKPGYYVSVVNGERRALVEGPFETHEQALARVEPARDEWYTLDGRTWFYAWGTARVRE